MFIATRTVTETTPSGDVVAHPKGAELATFSAWNNAVKAALLRMGYVQEMADASVGAEPASATPVPAPVVAAGPAATVVVASGPAPTAEAAVAPACPHCPGKLFANTQGLRLHMTRKHPRVASAAAQQG